MEAENTEVQDQKTLDRKAREEKLEQGDKVYFLSQKSPMTLKTRNERYLILTEPFYRAKTVYYSIVDLKEQWKAPNNLLYNHYDYEDQKDIERCLEDLVSGKIELSMRRGCKVDFDWEKTEARKEKNKKKK